jgi:hypothetical protein
MCPVTHFCYTSATLRSGLDIRERRNSFLKQFVAVPPLQHQEVGSSTAPLGQGHISNQQ